MHNAPVRFSPSITLFAFLAPFSVAALGCNTAKLTTATADAGCNEPALEFPCEAGPAGAPGCNGELDSGPALGQAASLPGSYPANCKVIVYDPVPDEDLQCIQLGTCECGQNDAGAYGWVCVE